MQEQQRTKMSVYEVRPRSLVAWEKTKEFSFDGNASPIEFDRQLFKDFVNPLDIDQLVVVQNGSIRFIDEGFHIIFSNDQLKLVRKEARRGPQNVQVWITGADIITGIGYKLHLWHLRVERLVKDYFVDKKLPSARWLCDPLNGTGEINSLPPNVDQRFWETYQWFYLIISPAWIEFRLGEVETFDPDVVARLLLRPENVVVMRQQHRALDLKVSFRGNPSVLLQSMFPPYLALAIGDAPYFCMAIGKQLVLVEKPKKNE